MSKILITKQEYIDLKRQTRAYRNLISKVFEFAIKDTVDEVIDDFKKNKFL